MQDKIFIYIDHSAGHMQSKVLNFQLTQANWPTQLAMLVSFNTKTLGFSMLFPDYTHAGIIKPNLLKTCIKNFIIEHELKENPMQSKSYQGILMQILLFDRVLYFADPDQNI